MCIFRVEREFEDTVAALKAALGRGGGGGERRLLKPGAWVIGQVKLGRRARHRKVADRSAAQLRSAGFTNPRVLHLLADREMERTVAARWWPAAAAADDGEKK